MHSSGEIPSLSAEEAIPLAEQTLLVDVRELHEWNRGHAPSAIHLPMSAFAERSAELPADQRMLVVCQIGGRSERVTAALVAAGYDAVNIRGGMDAWQAAGGPVVQEGTDPSRA